MSKSFKIIFITLVLLLAITPMISASKMYTIDAIKVVGNNKVKTDVIKKWLPFQLGDQVSKIEMKSLAEDAVLILKEKAVFFDVNVFPVFNDKDEICKVLVDVNGEWTYHFCFDVNPPYIMVEDKSFLGNDHRLGVELSTLRQEVYFKTHNFLNLKYGLYNQNKVVSSVYEYYHGRVELVCLYAKKSYGGYIVVDKKINDFNQVGVKLDFSERKYGTNLDSSHWDTDLGTLHQRLLSIRGNYTLRSSKVSSTDGLLFSIGGTLNIDQEKVYGNILGEMNYYTAIFEKLKGAIHLEGGYATEETPYFDLFDLNSTKKVRSKQIIVPGHKAVLVKGELIYPVVYGVESVVFADYGATWNEKSFNNSGLGYGLGLRYKAGMPVNLTFRLEAAFSEEGHKLYFVTGNSF